MNRYCSMIITIGFVPSAMANDMVKEIGGEIIRTSEGCSDIQFTSHKIRTSINYVTVRNIETRKYYKLYFNEFSSIHIC